jgi:hypothetical protein
MNKPVRTTLAWALLSGLIVYPALASLMAPLLGWPLSSKLILWAELAVYALLLSRWGRRRSWSILFPLAVLLGAALWPYTYRGYFVLLLGVLSWIRSGICFQDKPIRAVLGELVTALGGFLLVGVWLPSNILQWALGIWLFGLVQCLYFYIVPCGRDKDIEDNLAPDPFEIARKELEMALGQPREN